MKRFALALAAGVLLSSPTFAVDLTTQITQLDGKPLVDTAGKDVKFSVGDALKNALLTTDQRTAPDVKSKRFQIAVKISMAMDANKDVTFTPQEITEIETALWENQSTLVAGQAIRIIDATAFPNPPK